MAEQDRHRGAIDATREEFLFLNINEMVAEFAEELRADLGHRSLTAGRVICLAAHDQADEIAGAMLAQLLEQQGFISLCFPAGPDSEETIAVMNPAANDLICISALPPFAFTPARGVAKRLRSRFPEARIVVGVWGFAGDTRKAMVRFDRTPPDELFTNFRQVVAYAADPGPATQAVPAHQLDPDARQQSAAPLLPS